MSAWEPSDADMRQASEAYWELGPVDQSLRSALIAGAGPTIRALQLENAALGPLEKERDCYASACEHLNATIATLQRRVAELERRNERGVAFEIALSLVFERIVRAENLPDAKQAAQHAVQVMGDRARSQSDALASVQEQPK